MRRGVRNKISILLIVIIGIFTIFSYIFDQLVIREEDNHRITQIKFENINTKLSKLTSISSQLVTAYDTSVRVTIGLKRYKNYWLKSILLITDYDELTSELKDTEIINTFNDDPKYLEDLVKSRNIEQFVQVAISINEQIKRLENIYAWNLNFFPQYQDGEYYDGPDIKYLEIFNKNKNIFFEKYHNFYTDLIVNSKQSEVAVKNFKIQNWIDLNKYASLLLNRLDELNFIPLNDSYLIDDQIYENEELRYQVIEDLIKISSKKIIIFVRV